MWESVKEAYADHLSDISSDDLPEVLLVFYESIKLRVSLVETLGHIDNDEASYIAQDILYIADVIISQLPKSKEIESSNI